jgi:hypothetical protein
LREYVSQWDDIAKISARDAILIGSFDKFAESTKAKRGNGEVDDAFLSEIEKWRADLAPNLALRNPKLSQRDLVIRHSLFPWLMHAKRSSPQRRAAAMTM